MIKLKNHSIIILLVLTLMPLLSHAKRTHDKNDAQLNSITAQIQNISGILKNAFGKKSSLTRTLKNTEIAIGKLSKREEELNDELMQQRKELAILQQKEQEHQKTFNKQREILSQHLRASYLLGKQSSLKLLLTQQNPNKANQSLAYYGYLNNARLEIIQNISDSLEMITQQRQQIEEKTQYLEKLIDKKEQQRIALEKRQEQRQELLAQLNDNIETKDQILSELNSNKQNLEKVIAKLKSTRFLPFKSLSYSKQPQTLPLPTKGSITKHFGRKIESSELTYNGIFIKAPEKQMVHAIYPGKVVFADWLKGFGLLIIIDHGDGYMTLYARNNSLYKQTGDEIEQGDIIATVGRSGGHKEAGLYFEIRHNGIPENPETWLNKHMA